jgi:hypothetical protein
MAKSILEQYRIADFLEWNAQDALRLNPHFQRRAVWTKAAKVFLIDTILRRYPIPKVFIRTNVDIETKKSFREVVDGQQRLRAIVEFAADAWPLTSRATDFDGYTYSTLPDDMKEAFLTYPVAVEQLVNADDAAVLEMFARLNSYNVPLSAAELRHAQFQGEFKWAVHETAKRWHVLWDDYRIVGMRQRLRMREDALVAEMFGTVLEGIQDGGRSSLAGLYERYEEHFPQEAAVVKRVDDALRFIDGTLRESIIGTPLARPVSFLLLFAAVCHALQGIPAGGLGEGCPAPDPEVLADFDQTRANLARISQALKSGDLDGPFARFVRATRERASSLESRRVRFPVFWRALLPWPLDPVMRPHGTQPDVSDAVG